jgi:hypothetical protein
MADKKISALTAATTPLTGTEVLPIVQSGSTVKVSVNNLTAGKAVSVGSLTSAGSINVADNFSVNWGNGNSYITGTGAGFGLSAYVAATKIWSIDGSGATTFDFPVKLNNVNLVVSTAAKGIDFSANANAPGMTSELLNWYEEGTWSPSLFDSAGNPLTLGTAVGRYTRVGNAVTVTCAVSWTALGSAGATPLILAGLPFASANVAGLNQSAALGFIDGIDTVLGTKQITANLPLNVSYFTFKQTNDNAAPTDLAANSCSATGEIRLSTTYIV